QSGESQSGESQSGESQSGISTAIGLAPLAVVRGHQRRGIGGLLVREGLRRCLEIGHPLVFVLGHAHYYPRFGFVPASMKGFRSEYSVPDDVFMVAELVPGAASGQSGLVRYLDEFRGF
ncbi:MAG: N-acetyltransferase, partial [Acidobacteriota bacterium]